MAAPTVNGRQTGNSGTTSLWVFDVTLPASIAAGERLVVFIAASGGSLVGMFPDKSYSGHGWRPYLTQSYSVYTAGWVFTKIAEGGGLDRLRLFTDTATQITWVSFRISSDAQCCEGIGGASGSSANSEPPQLTLTCGSPTPEVLWIVCRFGDDPTVPSAAPADFTDLTNATAPGTSSASTSTAERTATRASMDPDVFTVTTQEWCACTFGFYADSSNLPVSRVTALALEVLTTNDDVPPPAIGGQLVIAT